MKIWLLLIAAGLLICQTVQGNKTFSFEGYRLYRADPFTKEAAAVLRSLHDAYPSEPEPGLGLTFFNYPSHRNVKVDILVPPRLVSAFRKAVAGRPDIQLELLHRNYGRVAAQADRENRQFPRLMKRLRRAVRRSDQLILNHNQYLRYDQLLEAVNTLAQQCNLLRSNTCRQQEIGSAYEGRKLIVLRIEKSQTDKQKRKVWIDGGIHAREWISPATVLYMADVLISKGLNRRMWTPEVVALLDYYDFLMLPLYNPDGYEYSHSHYRFWRKNRQTNGGHPSQSRVCRGVDLNRNYGYKWGGSGSSSDPCQDNYRGTGPFSAMESAAVKRFVEQENSDKKILLFLSYHSYGQYVLMPFGFKRGAYPRPALSAGKMSCVAFFGSREMFSTNHRFYIHGTSADVLYEASGGSDDWAHGSLEVPYSLTVELPDDGAYGFLLPPAYIRNVGSEAVRGLLAMLRTIHDLETNTNFYRTRCLAHTAASDY
ncbi:hypothetical protein BOX15_Mlig005120g1 [Macrostomum lignano]|uniref:Peptidase M14 domain-containing protein n=1 Tax=Macrostomum lignano TaxID=282301 RepID=A0A267E5G0_9PLAT|nr:hypothetical protein BOX15_Mlig005120g1 [Macrostomum lignano]